MKNIRSSIILVLLLATVVLAQKKTSSVTTTNKKPNNIPSALPNAGNNSIYKFESIANDPLNARIYTLNNGLKVYLTVNKEEPRIQSYIAINVGSKYNSNNSSGATALLSMFMMFNGTDKFGTLNYTEEKPLLDSISKLFDNYRLCTDKEKRNSIYKSIDSLSGAASKIGISSEYLKLITSIGGRNINANVEEDKTWYETEIPSNQLRNYLMLESERFRNPVVRYFHTGLENIYEGKNRSIDDEVLKIDGELLHLLFKKHPYSYTSDYGTIEQLVNPSITEVYDFYNRYYLPNNMALCLSGDLDYDETINMIEETFGKMHSSKTVFENKNLQEDSISTVIASTIHSKKNESVTIGFRFNAFGTDEADKALIISKILQNGTAGLFDLNLTQSQRVINAKADIRLLSDYSIMTLSAEARKGQKLEEVKELLLQEVERIKEGDFSDWLSRAVINEMKLKQKQEFQTNKGRVNFFRNCFASNTTYSYNIETFNRLSKITKQELVDFVRKYFNSNYAIVYKQFGEDKNSEKINKPKVTPIAANANKQSEFFTSFISTKPNELQPYFVNFKDEIKQLTINGNIPLWCVNNKTNDLFTLTYVFDFGSRSSKIDSLALDYLKLIGTSKLSPTQVNEAFYKLGCYYETRVEEDITTISLKGLSENFIKAVKLLESLLTDCQVSKIAYGNLLETNLKLRQNASTDKNIILNKALLNYGYFGKNSPYSNVLNDDDLFFIYPYNLTDYLKNLKNYKHSLWYYGNLNTDSLVNQLSRIHQTPKTLLDVPRAKLIEQLNNYEEKVFAYDFDMKQAEVIFLTKQNQYNRSELPLIKLFHEYFGDGLQSAVVQTMRFTKALAVRAYSIYTIPNFKEHSFFSKSYVGTQVDKLQETIESMHQLFDSLPINYSNFDNAKSSLLQRIRSERINPSNYCRTHYLNLKLGIDGDIRKEIYDAIPALTMNDLVKFHAEHYKNKNHTTLILGKKDKIKSGILEKYGEVKWLTSRDIFGY